MYGNINLTIEGEKISYKISAGIELKDGTYYMPSISFIKNEGHIKEKEVAFWDNDIYIIGTFLNKVIIPWIESNTIPFPKDFAEFLSVRGASINNASVIYELLNKSMDMGIFNNYLNEHKDGRTKTSN